MRVPRVPTVPVLLVRAWRRKTLVEDIVDEMPPRLGAFADRFRPGLREFFGGPLNAQERRQAMVEAVLAAVPFRQVVETGTFRGSTTEFLARRFAGPVTTVEVVPRFYYYSCWRLRHAPNVTLILGDSVDALRTLARTRPDGPAFFYLDAHWEEHLPLREEMAQVIAGWPDWVALLDDFQVPDDPGYGYDRYDRGQELTLTYLRAWEWPGVTGFWPATPSAEESGSRKGCLVLASASMAPALRGIPLLREVDTLRPATVTD